MAAHRRTPGAEMNGKPGTKVRGARGTRRQSRGFLAATLGALLVLAVRLSTWATILTIIFRCPSSLDACDETTPYVCKPYFQAKNAVAPHIQPYYDHYASPYVETLEPYYDTFTTKVWQPTRAYTIKYGAPWAEKAREHALSQWEKNGQPQLVKYQGLARQKYDESVAPYVSLARERVAPYTEIARTNALQVFYEYLLPSYEFVQPYAVQGYDTASEFATSTALPAASWAWKKTYAFLQADIWPRVHVVYVANVEPQLQRIGERLSRYKIEKKTTSTTYESVVEPKESAPSSFIKPPPQGTTAAMPSSSQSSVATEKSKPEATNVEYVNPGHPVEPPQVGEDEDETRRKAREMVAHDLEMWQSKFAAQADDGANDMEERVDEIAKRLIEQNVNTIGKDLLAELQATISAEIEALKIKIKSLVVSANESTADLDDQVVTAVRAAGMAIKKRAQAIRQWRETYDKELQDTVIAVADVHFQILDETRNLALQQIGMRWAWTDGVTYKDWAKYHELKSTLAEWTEQLKQLIVTHPALLEAQDASAQVEDEGMEIAASAAKELARLKEVGRWKLIAGDASDDFDSESMKLAAEAAEQQKLEAEAAKDETVEDTDVPADTLSEGVEAARATIAAVVGETEQELGDFVSSIAEPISSMSTEADQVTEKADEDPAGIFDVFEEATSAASSTVEAIKEKAASVASEVQETASGIVHDVTESMSSASEEETSQVFDDENDGESEETTTPTSEALAWEESGVLFGETHSIVGNSSEDPPTASDDDIEVDIDEDPLPPRDETPVSDEEPIKPVFMGAAAQKVPNRQPVLEDYVDTDIVSTTTGAAEAAYSSAVSRAAEKYSSAVSVVSAQIYGTPAPVHTELFASVSAAYDKAMSAASSKFSNAAEAAATRVKGTPAEPTAPTEVDWERVESIASQKLNEGRLWAEVQYQSALIALGLATPTPTAAPEQYYEYAKLKYYAGLGLAQERYSSFLDQASSALSSLTATPTPTPTDFVGSASSLASAARESAASAAQAAGNAAGSAVHAAGENIASVAKAVDENVSAVVDGANQKLGQAGLAFADSWNSAVAQISGQVYGEPTQIGWFENIFSDVSSYAAGATSAASDKATSATSAAQASAVTASAQAAKQYESVSELVSELISGKEPSFTESVLSRLRGAYATAAANVESLASEASKVGDKVGSAASQATDAVKDKVHQKDEL